MKKNIKYTLLIIIIFLLTRSIIARLYAYDFNLFCGDSAFYLYLSTHLNQVAADRPSGYPFFLALFSSSNFNPKIVINIQIIISFLSIILFYLITSRTYKNYKLSFYLSLILCLYPHTIFMERSYMPDSISISILLINLSLLFLSNYRFLILPFIGLSLGYLPLLRTNHLIFSFFLMGLFTVKILFFSKSPIRLKATKAFFLLLPFFILIFWYTNVFVYKQLGVKNLSNFGGKILFSNLAPNSSCKDIAIASGFNEKFLSIVTNTCNQNLLNQEQEKILWDNNGLIKTVNNRMGWDDVAMNTLYKKASQKLIQKNPLIIFAMFLRNLKTTLNISHINFYRNNYSPSLDGGCEDAISTYLKINREEFLKNTSVNLEKNTILLFSIIATIVQKIILLITFIFLFSPFSLFFKNRILKIKLSRKQSFLFTSIYLMIIAYFLLCIGLVASSFRHLYSLFPIYVVAVFLFCQNVEKK